MADAGKFRSHARACAEAAQRHGLHVVFGTLEPIDEKRRAYNLICMAYPDGRAPARYRRTHPNGPWLYTGGPAWEFQYVPGDDFPVFDTVMARLGSAMCSEVYMPEVARALALRGAELIFMPAGKDKRNAVGDVAHAAVGARHREPRHRGDDAKSVQPRGARSRHGGGTGADPVREHDCRLPPWMSASSAFAICAPPRRVGASEQCAVKQGLLGPQWQRPELYDFIYPRPLREAAE